MKSVIRILIGITLLYSARWLHFAAFDLIDKSVGIEQPVAKRTPEPSWSPYSKPAPQAPRPEDTNFFGEDPREVAERPEVKKKLKDAIDMDRLAVIIAVIGGLLIIWGLYEIVRVPLRWLVMPTWSEQRIKNQSESNEIEHGKPEAEKRDGVEHGQGDSGNLPVAPAPGGIERRDGRNIQGGSVGA